MCFQVTSITHLIKEIIMPYTPKPKHAKTTTSRRNGGMVVTKFQNAVRVSVLKKGKLQKAKNVEVYCPKPKTLPSSSSCSSLDNLVTSSSMTQSDLPSDTVSQINHEVEKTYRCSECRDRRFAQYSHFKSHMRAFHCHVDSLRGRPIPVDPHTIKPETSYTCEFKNESSHILESDDMCVDSSQDDSIQKSHACVVCGNVYIVARSNNPSQAA